MESNLQIRVLLTAVPRSAPDSAWSPQNRSNVLVNFIYVVLIYAFCVGIIVCSPSAVLPPFCNSMEKNVTSIGLWGRS
jgi:hypothetical protein